MNDQLNYAVITSHKKQEMIRTAVNAPDCRAAVAWITSSTSGAHIYNRQVSGGRARCEDDWLVILLLSIYETKQHRGVAS